MGNSGSHHHKEISPIQKKKEEISLCLKRRKLLLDASKKRHSLAYEHLEFNRYHLVVADVIKTFIVTQNPHSETQQYTVELPEDEYDEEVMEDVSEGGLNTRRQEINYVREAPQLSWNNNDVKLEFLQALEGVEKQFRNAYESGKDVSKTLESNYVINKSQSSQPSKLLRSLSRSSSRVHCSSFEEYEIMGSTLQKMESYEKKLHKDLKKEKKAMKSNADEEHKKLMFPSLEVSTESATFYSNQISVLRDERLLPKLIEQLDGMMESWKTMSKFYKTQKEIMSQVKQSPPLLCDDKHRKATEALKKKFRNWCSFFASYVSLQGAYIDILYRLLLESNSSIIVGDDRSSFLDQLKTNTKEVTSEIKEFRKVVEALRIQQRKEHYQKKEVERLEGRVDIKEQMINDVNEKQTREEIMDLKERIEKNKKKHQFQMQETQRMVNQFQMQLSSLFKKLEDLSRKATEIYHKFYIRLIEQVPRTPLGLQR